MYRAIFISEQVKILQKYIPELSPSDVLRYSNEYLKMHVLYRT